MRAQPQSPVSPPPSTTCYFSITPSPSAHYSIETPTTSPSFDYSLATPSDPTHPLLALRHPPPDFHTAAMDASNLLQLQTDAAHRAPASSTRSNSSTPTADSPTLEVVCVRCRRTCFGTSNVVKFGTSYHQVYCRHCASMVGYKDIVT